MCGVDGKNYRNACRATCKNVGIRKHGKCNVPPPPIPRPPFPGRWGTCRVWGDPHFVSFDGAAADFQVGGEYIFAQNKINDDQVLTGFFTGKAYRHLRYTGTVTVRGAGHSLTYAFPNGYDTRSRPFLSVDGQKVNGCGRVGHFSYCGSSSSASITSAHQLYLTVNWGVHGNNLYMNVDYRAAPHYQNQMTGMCGKFRGTHTPMPWTGSNGVQASLPAVGNSWYVGAGPEPNWPKNGASPRVRWTGWR